MRSHASAKAARKGPWASLAEIGRMDLRTSRSGDTATTSILRALTLQYRYQPARLAIGRSLGVATQPVPAENFDGRAIRGETLFGKNADELGMWISLIVTHAGGGPLSRRDVHDLVAAHWARGAGLLWDGLRGSDDAVGAFASQLSIAR